MRYSPILLIALLVMASGCGDGDATLVDGQQQQSMPKMAQPLTHGTFLDSETTKRGGVTLLRLKGLWLALAVDGLSAGHYGMHIHSVGRCDGPDFASADGHWNPTEAQHGNENPVGWHAGDLPNLIVQPRAQAATNTETSPTKTHDSSITQALISLPSSIGAPLNTTGDTTGATTEDGLQDVDGSALIIHAATDDLMTDPSGNSGARILCAVLYPPTF